MKTKTSLLAVLVAMASSATVMAQVYSLNVVGYVNKTIPAGFSLVANPLNTTNNTLSSIFANPPVNSAVYRFVGGSYQISTFALDDDNNLNWDNNFVLAPGEGFWIFNSGAAFTNTFVGEVAQGSLTNAVPAGFSLKGSSVPQVADLNSQNYPAQVNDAVYFFRNGTYAISTYALDDDNNLNWDSNPTPEIAEGFWVYNASASKEWVRSFTP